MKHNDIKRGMKVDYHKYINGPVTTFNCTVESGPRQLYDTNKWVVSLNFVYGDVLLDNITIIKEDILNKEDIYIRDIQPHINEIFKICKDNKIDMVAEFFVPTDEKPALCCSTSVIEDVTKIPEFMRDFAYHQKIQYILVQQVDSE